jgi:hypothetical protein
VYVAPTIVTTCINCISPGSLNATLALIVIGAGIALTAERRKLARVARRGVVQSNKKTAKAVSH